MRLPREPWETIYGAWPRDWTVPGFWYGPGNFYGWRRRWHRDRCSNTAVQWVNIWCNNCIWENVWHQLVWFDYHALPYRGPGTNPVIPGIETSAPTPTDFLPP